MVKKRGGIKPRPRYNLLESFSKLKLRLVIPGPNRMVEY